MNRETKFRAWDFIKKEMFEVTNIDFSSRMVHGIGKEGFNDCDGWDLDDQPECHLMEYTGLKDKNGKEICEGDILKDGDGRVESVVSGVEFCELSHGSGNIISAYRFEKIYDFRSVEIIGSIYENPDLLK